MTMADKQTMQDDPTVFSTGKFDEPAPPPISARPFCFN